MTETIEARSFSISMSQNIRAGNGAASSGVFVRRDSAEALTAVGSSETLSDIEKGYLIQDITVVDSVASKDHNLRRTLLDNVMTNMVLMETITPPPPKQAPLSVAKLAQKASQIRVEQMRKKKTQQPTAEEVMHHLQQRLKQTQKQVQKETVSTQEVQAFKASLSSERVQKVQEATNNAIVQKLAQQKEVVQAEALGQDPVHVQTVAAVEAPVSLTLETPKQTFSPVERPPVVLGASNYEAPEIVLPGSGAISTEALALPGSGEAELPELNLPGNGSADVAELDLPGSGSAEFSDVALPGSGETVIPVTSTFIPLDVSTETEFVPNSVIAETAYMMKENPNQALEALQNYSLPGQKSLSEKQLAQLEQLLMPA